MLMTNIDNITCDQVPYLIEELMRLGAKNVHVIPALTKKGRPEYIFLIDSEEEILDPLAEFMALETGALGVRVLTTEHYPFDYEIKKLFISFLDEFEVSLWEGSISLKVIKSKGQKPLSARVEYEQLKELASDLQKAGLKLSLYELREIIEEKALKGIKNFTANFPEKNFDRTDRILSDNSEKLCSDEKFKYPYRIKTCFRN